MNRIAAAAREMGDDPHVGQDPEPITDESPGDEPPGKLRRRVRRADSKPRLVATARMIRQLLPGDERYGDALSTAGGTAQDRIGRLVSEAQPDRPSAMRELGLGALQAWQALSEAQGRGRGAVDVAILFTDVVGFSTWALEVGDEAALELLRGVASAEDEAISANGGSLVKRLGDGSMSVFGLARGAVGAALEAQARVGTVEVRGHRPRLRAGVHLGRPRRVGRDYLGVDVNIAARVAESAKGGEVLVSEAARENLDPDGFAFGRKRRLSAPGAPRGLSVCPVASR
ncbi:MAG TPA: adenylate/guanylate cyclase domain-containing protein [Solirubrobacterales bacterium]